MPPSSRPWVWAGAGVLAIAIAIAIAVGVLPALHPLPNQTADMSRNAR